MPGNGPDGLVVGKAKDEPEPMVKVVEEETFKTGEECIEEEVLEELEGFEREKKKERKIDLTKSQYFSKYPKAIAQPKERSSVSDKLSF